MLRSVGEKRQNELLSKPTSDLKRRGLLFIFTGMTNALATRIAAIMGFLTVALGAFGAHGLKGVLTRNGTAAVWETAVFYQFVHVIMLFLLATRGPLAKGPWFSFLIGIVFFSGSLYLLAYTNVRWLGAITPIGGVSFLVGWIWLAIAPPKL